MRLLGPLRGLAVIFQSFRVDAKNCTTYSFERSNKPFLGQICRVVPEILQDMQYCLDSDLD